MNYGDSERLLQIIAIGAWLAASVGGFGLLGLGGRKALRSFLLAELVVQTVAALVLGGVLLTPLIRGAKEPAGENERIEFPAFDYIAWTHFVVQDGGRKKPLQSAAIEHLRNITGRSTFQKGEALPVFLQWIVLRGEGLDDSKTWEKEPFILCPDSDLRQKIHHDLLGPDAVLTEEQKRGKFITPEELRKSDALFQLLLSADVKDEEDSEKAMQTYTPLERKAREVAQRLSVFDQLTQNNPTTFGKMPRRERPDPTNLVALDRRGGGWFSLGTLRLLKEDDERQRDRMESRFTGSVRFPLCGLALDHTVLDLVISKAAAGLIAEEEQHRDSRWRMTMKDRLAKVPQLYISPERLKALEEFQQQVQAGTAQKALEELARELEQRRGPQASELATRFAQGHYESFLNTLRECTVSSEARLRLLKTEEFARLARMDKETLRELFGRMLDSSASSEQRMAFAREVLQSYERADSLPPLAKELDGALAQRDRNVIEDLQRRVASAKRLGYHPDDDRFRMLHLNYLESRFPNIYIESSAWQPYPRDDVNRVLACFEGVQKAYRAGDAYEFDRASQAFFDAVREVSEKHDAERGYPGTATAELELKFNRAKPFMWGWIIMLAAVAFLIAGLSVGRLEADLSSKICYGIGWLLYLVSLGFQVFGFYARIAIAGRAPVSNMYETVIFVAAMSAVFAMILELRYRRSVILLSGGVAACLGLVLADQLPNVLDPKINPLVPVLRSNYWLIIHVLTIVASYAGGALAWVIGNIALGMLAFGNPSRDALKSMSQFCYRAMQIAVILLAAGTFLGGWWAAESWGRFWGWDPKEVWALISLVCYVIPLHARYAGWVKDFGLAVSAVLCFAAIMMSWYGVNFVLGAGLHSYGFGGGGPWWVAWAALLNLVFLLVCCLRYVRRTMPADVDGPADSPRAVLVEAERRP